MKVVAVGEMLSVGKYSHERLVARANLLNENVVLGIEVWLDAAVRALRIQHWTAQ